MKLKPAKTHPELSFMIPTFYPIAVYADYYYFKQQPKALDSALSLSKYDLYLFCQNEIPWQPDGQQRDSPQAKLYRSVPSSF